MFTGAPGDSKKLRRKARTVTAKTGLPRGGDNKTGGLVGAPIGPPGL